MHLSPATPSVECARYSRELVKICGISAVRLVSLIGESTALIRNMVEFSVEFTAEIGLR